MKPHLFSLFFVFWFVCLFVCLFFGLFVCLFVCLFFILFTSAWHKSYLLFSRLPSSENTHSSVSRPWDIPCSLTHTCCSRILEYTPHGQLGTNCHAPTSLCLEAAWDLTSQWTRSNLFQWCGLLLDLYHDKELRQGLCILKELRHDILGYF